MIYNRQQRLICKKQPRLIYNKQAYLQQRQYKIYTKEDDSHHT
jgi:hypothetical protein